MAKKFFFQKVQGDLDPEEESFQVENLRSDGISSKISSGHKESNLRPPHQIAFNRVIRRFEESGGLTWRDQTEEDQHMAVTPVNIQRVDDYFTEDLSSICTESHNLNLSYSL